MHRFFQGGNVRRKLFVSTIAFVIVLCHTNNLRAQVNDLPALPYQGWAPTMLVDCPTAGTLRRATFNVTMRAYPNGGILAGTNIGLSNRFTLGVSYGSEGIISERPPNWNPRVEFNVKLSLVDEGLVTPAMTLGFCSQGYGSYIDTGFADKEGRYSFKSKGFYGVASKNYPFYNWQVGLHGGVNYSMEQDDDDKNLDFFVGLDSRLNKDVGFVMEYDFATNDDGSRSVGKGRGYLNMAIQWLYAENLVMEIILKNLVENRKGVKDIWRGLRVTYVERF
jgi:hypothetical protein